VSRDTARREGSWGKLREGVQQQREGARVIFNQVKGGLTVDLDGAWPSAALAG